MKSVESCWRKSYRDARKRNELARANDKLVHKVVHRMAAICREPYEDLYQIGYIGLLKAAERYNLSSGNAFSSFAVPYIQGEIQHYLRDQWQAIKIPRNTLEIRRKVKRLKRSLEKLGRQVEELEVALSIGLTQKEWEEIASIDSNLSVSLDTLIHEPMMADIDNAIMDDSLYESISQLNHKSRNAILERFFVGRSVEEIAKKHGYSSQEIKAHLNLGLRKLRTQLESQELL